MPPAGFEPATTRGSEEERKNSRPVRSTADSYEGIRTGGLSITASRKRGIGLPATLGYVHSDGSGRSVSDMPFGQDGQQTRELGESMADMSEGSNQVTSV